MQSSDPKQDTPVSRGGNSPGRFSLHGLSAAFARLTGAGNTKDTAQEVAVSLREVEQPDAESATVCEVLSPRMIVEGMLFVGDSQGRPITNRQLAANIRDVSPQEVDALIEELNQCYRDWGTAYEIVGEGAGYRMRLRTDFEAIRQRFHGRIREAKLTPPVIEVISIVAYRQPITAEEVSKLRGTRSHRLLAQLVRRGLLCLERTANNPRKPTYHTTERFNRLFGIDSPKDLPNSEDLDDF